MVLGKIIKYITLYSAVLFLIVTGNILFSKIHAQCTGSETPTTNVTSDYNGDDVSCAGVCDGEITITMTGGSVYGYQIYHQNTGTYFPGPTADDFQASNVFTALCQGDYDVTVLDSAIVYIPGLLYGECTGFETVSGSQGLVASFLGPSPPSCSRLEKTPFSFSVTVEKRKEKKDDLFSPNTERLVSRPAQRRH